MGLEKLKVILKCQDYLAKMIAVGINKCMQQPALKISTLRNNSHEIQKLPSLRS